MAIVEPLLLTITRLTTLADSRELSSATGFFFERDADLFLITNRHVVRDEATNHEPDSISIALHTDAENLAEAIPVMIPLYQQDVSVWREVADAAGPVDIVAIPIDRDCLPETAAFEAFRPQNIVLDHSLIEVGTSLLITGFPLGFYDTLHHLPVARQAIVASAFGLRFQGKGYFMTDARTHRGTSGAPVVTAVLSGGDERWHWKLLGVHAARLDMSCRDLVQDEALGLNCAWYADAILTITDPVFISTTTTRTTPPSAMAVVPEETDVIEGPNTTAGTTLPATDKTGLDTPNSHLDNLNTDGSSHHASDGGGQDSAGSAAVSLSTSGTAALPTTSNSLSHGGPLPTART